MKPLALTYAAVVAACSLFTISSQAQSIGPVGAPKLGYLSDAGSLRPVYGIPAAATAAPRIDGLPDLAQIATSPNGDFAMVSSRDSGVVSVFKETTSGPSLTPIDGAGIAPDLLLLSPRGQAGLLWFSSISRAQVITGFPDHPVWRYFDAVYLDLMPAALAVSDDGQWVAGAWSQGVYAFGPKGEVVRMQIDEAGLAVAFTASSHDFVVATSHRMIAVSDPGGRASVTTLLTAPDDTPFDSPNVASTGQRAIVAVRSGQITVVNTSDVSPVVLDCHCQPEGLVPMGSASFRLTSLQGGAFQLLDSTQNSIFLVPLGLAETKPPPTPDATTTATSGEGAAQ